MAVATVTILLKAVLQKSFFVWSSSIPCQVFVELTEFNPVKKTTYLIYTGNMQYRGGIDCYESHDLDAICNSFFSFLSVLDDSGWNTAEATNRYLSSISNHSIGYSISTTEYRNGASRQLPNGYTLVEKVIECSINSR